jgi:hypothetical protein
MKTKIYAVKSNDKLRLVEAINKQAALRHVAQSDYTVQIADQTTLIEAGRNGVQVERTVADAAE